MAARVGRASADRAGIKGRPRTAGLLAPRARLRGWPGAGERRGARGRVWGPLPRPPHPFPSRPGRPLPSPPPPSSPTRRPPSWAAWPASRRSCFPGRACAPRPSWGPFARGASSRAAAAWPCRARADRRCGAEPAGSAGGEVMGFLSLSRGGGRAGVGRRGGPPPCFPTPLSLQGDQGGLMAAPSWSGWAVALGALGQGPYVWQPFMQEETAVLAQPSLRRPWRSPVPSLLGRLWHLPARATCCLRPAHRLFPPLPRRWRVTAFSLTLTFLWQNS